MNRGIKRTSNYILRRLQSYEHCHCHGSQLRHGAGICPAAGRICFRGRDLGGRPPGVGSGNSESRNKRPGSSHRAGFAGSIQLYGTGSPAGIRKTQCKAAGQRRGLRQIRRLPEDSRGGRLPHDRPELQGAAAHDPAVRSLHAARQPHSGAGQPVCLPASAVHHHLRRHQGLSFSATAAP